MSRDSLSGTAGRQDSRWKVELLKSCRKDYDALSDSVRDEVLSLFDELSQDPFLPEALPLRDHRGFYRIRFYRGHYRMIYRIAETQNKVVVLKISRRSRDTYVGFGFRKR